MGVKGISAYPGDLDMPGEMVIDGIYRHWRESGQSDKWGVSYILHISGDVDESDESDNLLELLALLALDIPGEMDVTFIYDGSDTAVILHQTRQI